MTQENENVPECAMINNADADPDRSLREIYETLCMTGVDVFEVPLRRDFLNGGFHQHEVNGRFDVEKMILEMPEMLVCSRTMRRPVSVGKSELHVRATLWRFGERLWAKCDGDEIVVFADSLARARQEAAMLAEKFSLPPEDKDVSSFFILSIRHRELHCEPVKVVRPFVIDRDDMALHYGHDFPAWEDGLVAKMNRHRSGVTLLRGDPGTGKTTFIRHLISRLNATHCFYYLPASLSQCLGSPGTVDFWSRQNSRADGRRNVVIIEDAESLLEQRDEMNRSRLEDFLNVSDGLMSEFLRLQVVATINCPVEKLDPAITRAGRLVAYRSFSRMDRTRAQALATAKGLHIPEQENYSIAEIYAGKPVDLAEFQSKKLGFAA